MKSKTGSVFAAALVAAVLQPTLGHAQSAVPGLCHDGALPSGALSRICVPKAGWNGALVVYAHGYVPFFEPVTFHNLTSGRTFTFGKTDAEVLGRSFGT